MKLENTYQNLSFSVFGKVLKLNKIKLSINGTLLKQAEVLKREVGKYLQTG